MFSFNHLARFPHHHMNKVKCGILTTPTSTRSFQVQHHQQQHLFQQPIMSEKELLREKKLFDDIAELSKLSHSTVSMEQLIFFGQRMSEQKMVEGAKWLHNDLKIRIAKQVNYLAEMPKGLNLMPSVRIVREWYLASLRQLLEITAPNNFDEAVKYSQVLKEIYDRHSPTSVSVARGGHELRQQYATSVFKSEQLVDLSCYSDLQDALNNFYINRIGIRMLIGQHLELQKGTTGSNESDYVGLICKNTKPRVVIQHAVEDARDICLRAHPNVPDIHITGIDGPETAFPYVPSHLYYVVLEVLKNSLRATCETFAGREDLPPIQITIADTSDNEDICIKISDQGGGISRSNVNRIWSYMYTTAHFNQEETGGELSEQEAPLAGLGYGLPLSRVYCQYWGGSLNLTSLEGLGTDVYIHLNKKGNIEEPQLL